MGRGRREPSQLGRRYRPACDGTASTDRIIDAFESMFAEPRGAIATDVRAIIEQFRRLSLLTESPVEDEYGR